MSSYRIGPAPGVAPVAGAVGGPAGGPAGGRGGRPRRDAERNRRRIVDVAHSSFRAGGLDVPMAVVARRSGVGTATLYRHFPTKHDLIKTLTSETAAEYERVLDAALGDPDPWHGLSGGLRRLAALRVASRSCAAPFAEAYPDEVARHVATTEARLGALLDRARSGPLRDDVGIDDVRILLDAVDGVAATRTDPWVPAQRVVGHFLRSFARG
ncbi:TetR/AcrR family transcriptional regulator [Promicromonospora sp. NPDC050880]|uniref:TetR/AcrR family transcriptional regulator n=1 Tax=Promicromonospora sp. NPDC050880 TaxID=3364406 RepID=UPI0037A1EC02